MTDHLEKFLNFQNQLLANVSQRAEVIGLIFLGSAAAIERCDQYSDQDFFLVVQNGSGESFRQNLNWLPNRDSIAFSPRETAHGLKVVYANGDLLEFAVFEDSELELAAANDFRVVLDRQNLTERMAAIAKRSAPKTFDFEANFELLVSLLLIGIGRARRGEKIAATQHIYFALNHGLQLIRHSNPKFKSAEDSLNPFRRFEIDYPELGQQINELLQSDPETAGRQLLELLIKELPLTKTQSAKTQVVYERFSWV